MSGATTEGGNIPSLNHPYELPRPGTDPVTFQDSLGPLRFRATIKQTNRQRGDVRDASYPKRSPSSGAGSLPGPLRCRSELYQSHTRNRKQVESTEFAGSDLSPTSSGGSVREIRTSLYSFCELIRLTGLTCLTAASVSRPLRSCWFLCHS